ncbi:MAG TPA: flagellar hook-length control protein FliK [Hyphomicrobiales bacterium]|nr:flagellar hook-length control protein FliK [Hyphomicrobiales bacterium]
MAAGTSHAGAAPDPDADAADRPGHSAALPSDAGAADGTTAARLLMPASTPAAQGAAPAAQPAAVAAAAVPLAQFSAAVAARARNGTTDFAIRLDPPDLGQVTVHLSIAADGQIGAHFTVERPETLTLLRNDVRGLQDALQQAGFSPDVGAASFQLRSDTGQSSPWPQGGQQAAWQQQQQAGQHFAGQQQRQPAPTPPPTPASPAAQPPAAYRPRAFPRGGIDITV